MKFCLTREAGAAVEHKDESVAQTTGNSESQSCIESTYREVPLPVGFSGFPVLLRWAESAHADTSNVTHHTHLFLKDAERRRRGTAKVAAVTKRCQLAISGTSPVVKDPSSSGLVTIHKSSACFLRRLLETCFQEAA